VRVIKVGQKVNTSFIGNLFTSLWELVLLHKCC